MALVQERQDARSGDLEVALGSISRRVRVVRAARFACRAAIIGIVLGLIVAVLDHLNLLPDDFPSDFTALGVPFLAAGIGAAVGALKRVTPHDAARIAEIRLGLKERLSSALEFERVQPAGHNAIAELLRLQKDDALTHARSLHPKTALPLRWSRELTAVVVGYVVLLLAIYLPRLPVFTPPDQRIQQAIVAKAGQKLATIARHIEKITDAQQMPETHRAAEDMKRLAQQMARGRMDKRQALLRYNKLNAQMAEAQRKLAGAGAAGTATKSLSDAGKQLAQALQAAAKADTSNSSKAGQGQTGGASKNGAPGSAGSASNGKGQKPGTDAQQHGFKVPGFGKQTHGSPSSSSNAQSSQQVTKEIQQAAQAMQHGNASALSDQLRQLAQRTQSGQMSAQEKQQAQQDLQKLADALRGTPMPQTQQHAQAAADALKQGDTQKAADEMRKAADAADKETRDAADQQGMQQAMKSLQQSQQEMAGAQSPSDVGQSGQGSQGQQAGQNGQSGQQGQGQQGDQGQSGDNGQSDSGSGDNQGNGNGTGDSNAANSAYSRMKGKGAGNGKGQGKGSQQAGQEGGGGGAGNSAGHGRPHGDSGGSNQFSKFHGKAPHPLNPNFDPSRSPHYGRIFLGKPGKGGEEGQLGKAIKKRPGAPPVGGVESSVPYYNVAPQARSDAEKSVDTEDIPPAYRARVRDYFDSITPSSGAK